MKIDLHVKTQRNAAALNCAVGDYLTLDFEREYLPGVVAAEMGYGPLEAMKAQAVAARSVAYAGAILRNGAISDIGGEGQAFDAVKRDSAAYAQCHRAVEDTAGIVVTYSGKPVKTHYTASNGGRTEDAYAHWGGTVIPYEIEQPDPWDAAAGEPLAGHGVGMSQTGAMYAATIGKTFQDILAFYYPGTVLMGEYGEAEIEGTEAEPVDNEITTDGKLRILQAFQTKNLCYQSGYKQNRSVTHVAPLVHSTGSNKWLKRWVDAPEYVGENAYGNHWNSAVGSNGERFTKMVHAFIGLDNNGEMLVVQTLPYQYPCWGCADGSWRKKLKPPKPNNGSYNYEPHAHIQFEICQGSDTDAAYYALAIEAAELYCVYLCQRFGFPPELIVSHKEAAELGYASNHGDPDSWMKCFGDPMDAFRERVAARMAGEDVEPVFLVDDVAERRTVKNGSKGADVAELQAILIGLGYDLGVWGADGKFGPQTEKAVMAFQGDSGLVADGICGKLTWKAVLAQVNDNDPDQDEENPDPVLWTATVPDLTTEQKDDVLGFYPQATAKQQA